MNKTKKELLEELVRERICAAVANIGSLQVEVLDHDKVQGVVVQVEIHKSCTDQAIAIANEQVRTMLNEFAASRPDDPCLAGWTVSFTRNGRTIATSWCSGNCAA